MILFCTFVKFDTLNRYSLKIIDNLLNPRKKKCWSIVLLLFLTYVFGIKVFRKFWRIFQLHVLLVAKCMEPLKKISLVALIPLVVSLIAVYNGMKMFMKLYILISSQLLKLIHWLTCSAH